MLRLNPFNLHLPNSLPDALQFLDENPAAKICAGGTDLLPNLKHELFSPKDVIHLEKVGELVGIDVNPHAGIQTGAMTRLADIRDNPDIQKHFPALAKAAGMVAGPQLQEMGTIGGNIALDTRCLYYNQSSFWRESLGYCLKKDGDACHVTGTGKRCVAAASNDTATALIALDAKVTIQSMNDERTIPLLDFYNNDGAKNNTLAPNEMITTIHIPFEPEGCQSYSAFEKVRYRNSIDFPLVSVACKISFSPAGEENIHSLRICINALAAKPKLFQPKEAIGYTLAELDIPALARAIAQKCHPLKNICGDLAWRKEMIERGILIALQI